VLSRFQIIVTSGLSFTTVDMWDALDGFSAGSDAKPHAVSMAKAILYLLFSVVCIIKGVINDCISLKHALCYRFNSIFTL
jgi:hypothetical protein